MVWKALLPYHSKRTLPIGRGDHQQVEARGQRGQIEPERGLALEPPLGDHLARGREQRERMGRGKPACDGAARRAQNCTALPLDRVSSGLRVRRKSAAHYPHEQGEEPLGLLPL